MPEGDNNFDVDFDDLIKDRFFLGGPDEVADQIIQYSTETGINHHIFSVQWLSHAAILSNGNHPNTGRRGFP